MSRVLGKIALVTGAASGIGYAIARRLAEHGAHVVIADLELGAAKAVAKELSAAIAKGAASAVKLDVREEASWKSVVDGVVAKHARLDILVNNAGIAEPPPKTFEDITLESWKRVLAVNLDGVFLGTREGVRAMKATGGGSIINMGSVAAYIGTPGGAAYGSSKGGVRSLTKQAAVACAKNGYNIRINAIHPCYVWTPLVEKRATAVFGAERAKDEIRAIHPFRCLAEPVDVANAALFLASDEARLINGSDLVMDGGLLAQ
jgi:3(or 17)beta-hydroxysteroid dehydrogenase